MTNELDKQKVLEWAENKRGRYDFNYWFSEFITEVSKGSFDSNRVAELEEQLKQAVWHLNNTVDTINYLKMDIPNEMWTDGELGAWERSGVEAIASITAFITSLSQGTDKFKRGDIVIDLMGQERELIDIQYEHNRYQLSGTSGWLHGIENIKAPRTEGKP